MRKSTTNAAPSRAVRAANAFDRGVAAVRKDMSKPATESTTKRVGAVGLVAGAGFALGAWLA